MTFLKIISYIKYRIFNIFYFFFIQVSYFNYNFYFDSIFCIFINISFLTFFIPYLVHTFSFGFL